MAVQGVDYSSGYGARLAGALVAGKYRFAMRYISHPGNPKNLTGGELAALHAAGLGVGIVFETTANRPLKGSPAGKEDADSATPQLAALGLPDAAVYFAADFDAAGDQLDTTVAYIRAAAGVLGRDRTGVYGGVHVIEACAAAEVCTLFWQTSAWSGGRVSPSAHLYQHVYDVRLAGAEVDVNDLLIPPAGITWPNGAPTVRGRLHLGDTGADVRALQTLLNTTGNAHLATDGVFGVQTLAALRHAQSAVGVSVDGIYGPVTKAALTTRERRP